MRRILSPTVVVLPLECSLRSLVREGLLPRPRCRLVQRFVFFPPMRKALSCSDSSASALKSRSNLDNLDNSIKFPVNASERIPKSPREYYGWSRVIEIIAFTVWYSEQSVVIDFSRWMFLAARNPGWWISAFTSPGRVVIGSISRGIHPRY